jgi:hypothetical protein
MRNKNVRSTFHGYGHIEREAELLSIKLDHGPLIYFKIIKLVFIFLSENIFEIWN